MLETARLLTFVFRSVALLLLLSLVWIAVADRYNEAIVSVANPLLPAEASATAIGPSLVFEGPNVSPPVSIDGYALHYGLILMAVLVLGAVGIGVIPRLAWLLALGAGAFLVHVAGVALLARGVLWAADPNSSREAGQLVFSSFAVF